MPVRGPDGDVGMEAEAGHGGRSGAGECLGIAVLDEIPRDLDPSARMRARGDPAQHRSAVERSQQRLIARQRIGFFRIGVRTQAPPFQLRGGPVRDAAGDLDNLGIVRGPQRVELGMSRLIGGIDPIWAISR